MNIDPDMKPNGDYKFPDIHRERKPIPKLFWLVLLIIMIFLYLICSGSPLVYVR